MLNLIAAAAATVAQAPAQPAAPKAGAAVQAPAANGTQAAFDAASRLWEAGECAKAVPAFDALAASPAIRRNGTATAAVAVRRGLCLVELGRRDAAEASIRSGVDSLATKGPAFADEVREAYRQLARLAMVRLDYDAGIAAANRSLALSSGDQRVLPLTLLATLTRFDGDGAAVRYSAEALRLIQARPGTSKEAVAVMQVAAARALLAAGKIDEADALLKKALATNGGLTSRTTLDDVAVRYDLAQVALLKKRTADAQLYLAYTGAGRTSDTPFTRAGSLDAPPCGVVPGMTPDSYAVVEFSLADDGTVTRAEPVYAQGGRDVALAFARAVRDWNWTPEAAKAVPPFFRLIIRVELRCTRASGGEGIGLPLASATEAWLEEKGVAAPADDARTADLVPRWRAAAAGNDAAALDGNLRLAWASNGLAEERAAAANRAVVLAGTLGAPQAVRTEAALAAAAVQRPDAVNRDEWRRNLAGREAALRALLARPEIAAEPIGAATLRLGIVDIYQYEPKRAPADTPQLLAAVADARDLPEHHPLRVRALLTQANAAAARGDMATAAAAFARTGLTEQQCALIGPTPTMASSGAASSLYPMDLMRMGFEGWARIEYDIAADGRTADQRTLIAYPPFLFGDAAKAMIAKTRYVRSYRPETSVACAANRQAIRFVLPERARAR